MTIINKISELKKKLADCISGEQEVPLEITFCEGLTEPVYTITITKRQANRFVDESGRTWVLEEDETN